MALSQDCVNRLGVALANVSDATELITTVNNPNYDSGNTVFTGTGNITMAAGQKAVVVNKGTGAATTVTLPPSPATWQTATVKDGKGDAGTNNITIQAATGNIDGQASIVIKNNYGSAMFLYNGTQWNTINLDFWDAIQDLTIPGNLTLLGAFFDSNAGAVSAAGSTQSGATQLTADDNNVSTVAASAGVALPAATAGRCVTVVNNGANALSIYPINAGTDQINALGANNPTLLPIGQLAVFECAVAGTWNTLVTPPRAVSTTLSSVGAGTITAAGIVGGLTVRSGAQTNTNFTDTTASAAAIIAALHGAAVGQSWEWTYQNTTNATVTLANGSSVTVSGITVIPPGTWANFLVTVATSSTVTIAGYASGPNIASEPVLRTTSAPTNATATMSSGVLSDLTQNVTAGQHVAGFLTLIAKNSTGGEGLQIDFNGGTATFTSVFFGWAGVPQGATLATKTSTALATAITASTVDTADEVMTIYFQGIVNAGGTVVPRFGEVSHTSGTATVEIGSTFALNNVSN